MTTVEALQFASKKLNCGTLKEAEAGKVLSKLSDWVSSDIDTADIVKVVRCKKCTHYKKYHKKNDRKAQPFYACNIDHQRHDPEYYCRDGDPK